MKLCETEIVTFTEGRRSRFCARGTLAEEDGAFVVRYADEGDAVTLTVREGSLAMAREGKLSAVFQPHCATEMRVLAGESCGTIPVRTEELCIRRSTDGFTALLRYRLCFPADEQKFTLKIAIGIISEEG